MRGATTLPAKNILNRIYPMGATWRLMTVSTPSRQEKNEPGEAGGITNNHVEPVVTFSKPPLPPPVLGPLVALSLLEMSSSEEES